MESFVARHVILKIFWHGDIDGTLDASGNPKSEFFCLTRRYAVTILIFVATLIPALIVDDIGPVLSITGAVGGSMLSYMAPGIAFIGVNGNHFLSWAQNNIDSRNFRKSKKEGDDVELPIEGQADQQLYQNSSSYQKPFWWYPALMPIWCSLASTGDIAMKKRESEQNVDVVSNGDDDVIVHYPTTMDYFIAIFFIVFGAIAMVAGVGSNVYVHINNAY
jgi:Transmembrane amino acid transporter protein